MDEVVLTPEQEAEAERIEDIVRAGPACRNKDRAARSLSAACRMPWVALVFYPQPSAEKRLQRDSAA